MCSSGLEAESERLNREQRKVREQLERECRERDEKAGKTDGQSDGNEGEGNEGSSNATARAIELTITDFQKKIDESAKQVGVQLKETEKEIMKLKEDVSFERGFRRFLFWATPALLLVQSIIMIISFLA